MSLGSVLLLLNRLRVYLESKNSNKYDSSASTKAKVLYSTVNLIDLAGSESAEAHKSAKAGPAKYEMLNINRSLLTLTAVISKLSEKSNQWIPYRDSKLTKYLENALQGNAKISVICNISPGDASYEQSQSTLMFATMAKKIKQTVQRNETTEDDKSMIITRLEGEIKALRERLKELESSKGYDPVIIGSIQEAMKISSASEMEEVKGKLAKLASKIASSKTLRDTTTEKDVVLPETFTIRVSQILNILKQQDKAEEMKKSSIMNSVIKESGAEEILDVTPFELSGEISFRDDLAKFKSATAKSTVKDSSLLQGNQTAVSLKKETLSSAFANSHELERVSEVDSAACLAKEGDESLTASPVDIDKKLGLIDDMRPQVVTSDADLIGEEPVILLPEYLDSKLSIIKMPENTELGTILHQSEEALVGETVIDLQRQLTESDHEKQRLRTENKELTLAVSEMTGLLEDALNELKGYRAKYGEIYK